MKKFSRKSLKIGSFTLISTAVVLALIIFVNLFISELPSTLTAIDTTSEKLYDIGDTTKELLGKIDDEIDIYMLVESGTESKTIIQVEELIQKYIDRNSKITFSEVDPALKPAFAKQYTEDTLSNGAVIVTSGEKSRVIKETEWFVYDTQYGEMDTSTYQSYQAYGYVDGTDPLMFYGEMKLTGALSFVTSDDLPKIYFTTGHGEATLNSTFLGYISNENIETETVNLITGESCTVPDDCDLIFINMPQQDFTEAEADAVKEFYSNGGDVLLITYCLYYNSESLPNLTSLANSMGLEPTDGIIIEGDSSHYMQYPYYLVPNAANSGPLSYLENYTFLSAFSHGLKAVDGTETEVLELLTTSDKSFIKSEVQNIETFEKEDGDTDGPFATAAMTANDTDNGTAYFTWFASPCSVDPDYDMGGGNSALFTSVINWMCEKETNVSILGVDVSTSPLSTTEGDVAVWGFVTVGVIPLAILAGGFVIWFKRRRK